MLSRRSIRMIVSAALSAALGVTLIATIYLTRFDLQWLAFLGGVLFAAVLALMSQASKAEWLLVRRSKQLERARDQLTHEIMRSRNAMRGLQAAEERIQLLSDHLPIPVLYFGRDERCQYHNQASAQWLGLPPEKINGRLLHEIFGSRAFQVIAPQVALTLSGKTADYELAWPGTGDALTTVKVRQIASSADDGKIIGFYLAMGQSPAEPAAADVAVKPAEKALPAPAESGETLYPRSIADESMIDVDPRARLVRALQQDEFLLFAQKILSLKVGLPEPDCYEVLLRLKEEEDNLLPPGGFIPIAQHCGMLEEIDRWVVRSLIAWCLHRRRTNPAWRMPLFCINLSAASVSSPEFATFVRSELKHPDLPARTLCFEISEPDVIKHQDSVRRLIAELRPAGCRFSIDDFGSAKGSFSDFEELTVDFLKIDGSIIQNILRDPAELAKAHAINTACRKAGTRTVAELVETSDTLDKLREIGIDYVQGFGIARPGPINTLPA